MTPNREEHSSSIKRSQTSVTRFFRNPGQLRILGELVGSWTTPDLKVGVVGSGCGMEVYSIRYSIWKTRPDLSVHLCAVDIDHKAIALCRAGIYPRNSPGLESISSDAVHELFDDDGDSLHIKPAFAGQLTCLVADVTNPTFVDLMCDRDIIFANNFLIHMHRWEAEKCLRNIARCLAPTGYIFTSGVDLDVRSEVMRSLNSTPLLPHMVEAHEGDQLLRQGWPRHYWGLEPFDKSRADWCERYSSVFRITQ